MTPAELRQWRKASSLTQAKAAAYLAIPLTTYQNYEQGNRAIPDELGAKTRYTPSGAPANAGVKSARKPYPTEDLREYMQPDKIDKESKSMNRWVEKWGGWFTIEYIQPGGWRPTAWRGTQDHVGEPGDITMPLGMVQSLYPAATMDASLTLAGEDRWRRMLTYYARYDAQIAADIGAMQAAGTW